jgi:hypothetical protein
MSLLNKENDPIFLKQIIQICEEYIFLVFKISERRSLTGNSVFYNTASKYNSGKIDKDELYETIYYQINYFDTEDEKDYYRYWDRVDGENFIRLIDKLYKRDKKKGFYAWTALKYFLYEYELYLMKNHKTSENKIKWSDINDESIEHIYPQTENKYWSHVSKGINKKDTERFLHSIGNLTLLANNKNSTLGNKCFSDKKELYSFGSYSEIEISKYESWGRKEIYKRSLDMLDFLEKRWGGDLSADKLLKLKEII